MRLPNPVRKTLVVIRLILSAGIVLFFSSGILSAQDIGTITGQVSDLMTREVLEYASVAIYKTNDSSLVTGVITNQSGNFKIENLNQDKDS